MPSVMGTPPSGQGGESNASKASKMGHLGSHELKVTTGRLFDEDITVSSKKKDKITGDKTVPDGNVAKMTDQLGRTFLFSKKKAK